MRPFLYILLIKDVKSPNQVQEKGKQSLIKGRAYAQFSGTIIHQWKVSL